MAPSTIADVLSAIAASWRAAAAEAFTSVGSLLCVAFQRCCSHDDAVHTWFGISQAVRRATVSLPSGSGGGVDEVDGDA